MIEFLLLRGADPNKQTTKGRPGRQIVDAGSALRFLHEPRFDVLRDKHLLDS